MSSDREHFGSRLAVILAMAGSAIGLGNIWRFPYMVGEYGGAVFILIYILCSFILALPIFLAESLIGRRSRRNAIAAMKTLAPGSRWSLFGYLSVFTPVVILSYYCIVGGWSLEYLLQSFSLGFSTFEPSGWTPLLFSSLFLAASCSSRCTPSGCPVRKKAWNTSSSLISRACRPPPSPMRSARVSIPFRWAWASS